MRQNLVCMKKRFAFVLLFLAGAIAARALYVRPQLATTPIDRLVRNLTALAKEKPKDARVRFNLARVHAMAYASKADETKVRKGKESQGAWFGYEPSHVPFRLAKTKDEEKLKRAKAHLNLALQRYLETLELKPDFLSARLGYGWCLQQAGKTGEAVAQYRRTIEEGWEKESNMKFAGLGFHSVVVEASRYLVPLLEKEKDKEEIAVLKQRADKISRIPRPITPLAVPLSDGLEPGDLVDLDARVRFDADGSGLPQVRTWITKEAAWLVYDHENTGRITSGLQLFGNVTFWLFWEDGYQALATLDDDADGKLSGQELHSLLLWRDADQDGVCSPRELLKPQDLGIVSLSTEGRPDPHPHSRAWAPKGVTFKNGTTRPTHDLLLYRK